MTSIQQAREKARQEIAEPTMVEAAFEKGEMQDMAQFVAELTRQGIDFKITREDGGRFFVQLTGGC